MELKQYQQDTLNDLAAYMRQLTTDNNLRSAYANFWKQKGIDLANLSQNRFLHAYDNSIAGVPRVMFKVPTAGGKTFIACNALRVIFDHLPNDRPRVVAWFVPSDSILKQTYQNLKNPNHPYRMRINSHFNNRVVVVDKETALSGTGIQPNQIADQLTIFVLSVQSFAANNKDGRRVFRENSSLAEYAHAFGRGNQIDGADETSLIQAIAHLNPIVIIDESHNFEAKLRIEMFQQINPSFILDLTATPREKSNIISFVDAKKLKDAHMVKLPVVLYNRASTNEVLIDAIQLQRTLEQRATTMRKNGGRYIRPIVLFQAQPKSDKDSETFEKVKNNLVEAGIPQEQIKIKTAEKDELKGLDLMSESCEVRYIITVNALKEGWDCPFAYILASLANKSSQVDVEQILGRILRLPYTVQHADEFLNLSYVFTASQNFRETIEAVIKSLNNAGFSSKDYRLAEPVETTMVASQAVVSHELFGTPASISSVAQEPVFDVEQLKTKLTQSGTPIPNNGATESIKQVLAQAQAANKQYENENQQSNNVFVPIEIADNMKTYTIKNDFRDTVRQIVLPMFVQEVSNQSIFEDNNIVLLTKTMLSEGFLLENADKNIDFTRTAQEVVRIDLEERSHDEYVPKQYTMNEQQLHAVRELFAGYNLESKRRQLTGQIAKRLRFDDVHEPHITNYIKSVLEQKSAEELTELFDHELQTEQAFKNKILNLIAEHQYKKFKELIDKDIIKCKPQYDFPDQLTLNKKSMGLSKGLYIEEGDMNNFEYQVISTIVNLENIHFWHRNPERGQGFCINGFINHYPDFIIRTRKGKIIVVETKGDDRDNTDSRNKLELGNYWANKAGENFRYFMVFDQTKLEGAYTLTDFIDILKEL
ncbi:MAG: DEAD/DEAH box helicase [Paludibacteraceae bacterium]